MTLRECRVCHALTEEADQACPQCGSAGLAGVGVALAQQLAVKQALEAFEPTYRTWDVDSWDGVGLDMPRLRLAVRYQRDQVRQRKIIQGAQIIGVKVVEAAGVTHNNTRTGSQLGRAALGGVLLGGVGALLGGMSAKSQSRGTVASIEVLITTREPGWPLVTITALDSEYPANSGVVAQARRFAEVWAARVEEVMRQCQAAASAPATPAPLATGAAGGSVADELGKLAWLRDHGEISAEEFALLKRQLLDRVIG